MKRITDRADLVKLAVTAGVRPDWHEPDEQGITARVEGKSFDNAGFWPDESTPPEILEHHVILSQDGRDVAAVNLADLFAWATDPH
jgi:hypothetical protein